MSQKKEFSYAFVWQRNTRNGTESKLLHGFLTGDEGDSIDAARGYTLSQQSAEMKGWTLGMHSVLLLNPDPTPPSDAPATT